MNITITTIENNSRDSSNNAILNGLNVEIDNGSKLTGSEKQIAWATQIRKDAILLLAKTALSKICKTDGTLFNGDELDAAITQINSELMPRLATMIEPITSSRVWIDNRGLDAARVAQAVAK